MIEAIELRKGNCVKYNGIICFVSQIMWNRVEVVIKDDDTKRYEECSYDDIEPMLVTPNELLDWGFVKHERFPHRDVFHLTEHNFIVNILAHTCEVSFGLDGSVALIRKGFIFLHQLQNLFFSMTQHELQLGRIMPPPINEEVM
jgi:hypothetical protein